MSPQIAILKSKFNGLLAKMSERIDSKLASTAAAVSADKLTNPFTLSFTGDATGSRSVAGNANVAIPLTLTNTAVSPGTYPKVTVDAKGRVIAAELLIAADIPALPQDRITGLPTALSNKVETSDVRLTDSREWVGSTVSQAEAEGGTATTRRAWTAQRVRQAIDSWWGGSADKTKLDGIAAGAQVNVGTTLTWSATATSGTMSSSTGGNAALAAATTALAGLMTAADKSKLNGIDAGATANSADSTLLNRAYHTGSQAIGTVSGLQGALDAKFNTTGGSITGIVTFGNTSNATSSTSGSARVSGGLGVVLDIYAGGNITAYSDITLKTDIVPIDNALQRIRQVNGVTFKRKDTGQIQAGFIAQEMYKVLPQVVTGKPGSGKLGIAYGNVTALLAEGIKELDREQLAQVEQIRLLTTALEVATGQLSILQSQMNQFLANQ